MYAIIVKDTGDTYDVIAALKTDEEVRTSLDAEWEKGLPVVGMDVNSHKATATKGSNWNGTSFDGTANAGFSALSQAEKDAYRQYAFLCDNKIVHRVSMPTDSDKAALYDAAFAGEVFLVKCAFAVNGIKVTYNKTTRELSAV
jgi:hypothetical protein